MVYLTEIAKRVSAKMRHTLSDDPLLRPLGRACDSTINKALAARSIRRSDLFTKGKTLASHRHRIAKMLTAYHFSTRQITTRHWPELKLADHLCAHCTNKRRCDRWLRGRRMDDSPRRFCPNMKTFERWRRGYLLHDYGEEELDRDPVLEGGLAQTREMRRQLRAQGSSPSCS